MQSLLMWTYIVNSMLLIVHEIDSSYWQEWKLFHIPGGITSFLLLHIPLVLLVQVGLLLLCQGALAGLIISIVLGVAGISAFAIHMIFLRLGHPEFKTPVSIAILIITLIVSVAQIAVTVPLLAGQ